MNQNSVTIEYKGRAITWDGTTFELALSVENAIMARQLQVITEYINALDNPARDKGVK